MGKATVIYKGVEKVGVKKYQWSIVYPRHHYRFILLLFFFINILLYRQCCQFLLWGAQ